MIAGWNIAERPGCLAPWIHLHVVPDGAVYPCCVWQKEQPIAKITGHPDLDRIWNSQTLVKIRSEMLTGIMPDQCFQCFVHERAGHYSQRRFFYRDYGRFHPAIEDVGKNASLSTDHIVTLDLRLSNLCNLRCRSCYPGASSSWWEDYRDLYGQEPEHPKLIRCFQDKNALDGFFLPLLDNLVMVYFAGGEPLIMPEHDRILDLILAHNRNEIELRYNTNLTVLGPRKDSLIEKWNRFDRVCLDLSLDAVGQKGEYLRKGGSWGDILDNLRLLRSPRSSVQKTVNCTLGATNCLAVLDLHRLLVEEGFVQLHDFHLNLLIVPEFLSLKVLPANFKRVVRDRYREHIAWIEDQQIRPSNWIDAGSEFASAITYLFQEDRSSLQGKFFDFNAKLDRIRAENLLEVFPEFSEIHRQHYHRDPLN